MAQEIAAKISAKGQITVPGNVRMILGVGPGDRLVFTISSAGEVAVHPRKRRSIIDMARENPIEKKNKSGDLNALIDASVTASVVERTHRSRPKAQK